MRNAWGPLWSASITSELDRARTHKLRGFGSWANWAVFNLSETKYSGDTSQQTTAAGDTAKHERQRVVDRVAGADVYLNPVPPAVACWLASRR